MHGTRTRTLVLPTLMLWASLVGLGRTADIKLPNISGSAQFEKLLPALQSAKRDDRPRSVYQLRARYEADRMMSSVLAAMKAEDYSRATKELQKAEALFRRADDFDGEKQYVFQLCFGMIALAEKRFDDGERSLRAALDTTIRATGRETVRFAELNMYLAMISCGRGDLVGAKPSLDAAYPIYRKLDDPEDRFARYNLLFLAGVESSRKRPDLALNYCRELCILWRRVKNPEQEDHLLALRGLAKFHYETGDLAAARNGYDAAAELSTRLNGADHADTKELREAAMRLAGEFEKTVQWAQLKAEVDRLEKEINGINDADSLRRDLPKMKRMTEILKLTNGATDEVTLEWLFTLACAHDRLNDLPQAVMVYEEYLVASDQASPTIGQDKAVALVRLARAESNLKRWPQARLHAERAAAHYGADPKQWKYELTARNYLAMVECASGNWSAALAHVDRYIEICLKLGLNRRRHEVSFRARVAFVCSADPKLRDRCRAILEEAAQTAATEFGAESEDAGQVLQYLAMFQYRAGDPACVESLLKTDRILSGVGKESPAEADYRRLRIAKYHRAFGKLEEARTRYEAELNRLSGLKNPDVNQQAIALGFLAGIDAHQGRKPAAEEHYRAALELLVGVDEEVAVDLTQVLSKQRDGLASGRLPSLASADNADGFSLDYVIP